MIRPHVCISKVFKNATKNIKSKNLLSWKNQNFIIVRLKCAELKLNCILSFLLDFFHRFAVNSILRLHDFFTCSKKIQDYFRTKFL